MTSKQQLVAFIGMFLIGLTIWQHWRGELSVILFNDPTLHSLATQPSTSGDPSSKQNVDQWGNPQPGYGGYTVQPNLPGSPTPGPQSGNNGYTIVPSF